MKLKSGFWLLAVLAVGLISLLISGCGGTADKDKPVVRVAICQQNLAEGLKDKLREHFPDVEFQFTLANNSMDYYGYLYKHDDLPDIITLRRFSMRNSLALKDTLVDLRETDVASGYYQNYLQNYTYSDGSVCWLPAVAEVWCILANKTLFDEYGIPLPTDYPSFIAACKAFEAHGVKGFTTDWAHDYTSLEALQGFNLSTLQTFEGKKWRMDYENGVDTSAEDAIWQDSFRTLDKVLADTGNKAKTPEEAEKLIKQNVDAVQKDFDDRKVAMIRGGGAELRHFNERNSDTFVMLPYFGATESDNWVMTYPSYQAAINKNSTVDAKLLLEIFTYMLGQECTEMQTNNINVLSYTSAIKLPVNEDLSMMNPYIDTNRVYIRIASNEFFSASHDAVQGLVRGDYTPDAAYEAFRTKLNEPAKEPTYDLNFEKGYKYGFDEKHGNQAVSAILNSCREVWGTDIAVTYPISCSNSVYAGPMASSQIKYLFAGNYGSSYSLELTGQQVKDLIDKMMNYQPGGTDTFGSMLPRYKNLLPVTSGCEIVVSKNKGLDTYKLEELTIGGEPIDVKKTYTMVFSAPGYYAPYIAKQAGVELNEANRRKLPAGIPTLKKYLVEQGRQLMEPTDYITIKD